MKRILRKIVDGWNALSLVVRILIGLAIGALLGVLVPRWTFLSLLGTLFVGALKAIAPVLVFMLVMSAIAKAKGGLGARFRSIVVLYLSGTLLAAVLAVIASTLFPVAMQLSDVGTAETSSSPGALNDVFTNLLSLMVQNPLLSIVNANYIGVLFWAVILGLGLKRIASTNTVGMIDDLADVLSMVVRWIIQCAPFGILGLVFQSVSERGLDIFATYGQLILLLVGCMLTVMFVLNPLIVLLCLRRNPYPLLWRCVKESAIPAFFTRSSAANIPVNMQLCKSMGLDRDFYSVSIPLGSTINMEGAAITINVMTLAVCHTLGLSVSLPTAIALSVIAALAACGASGVAGGSLLLIPMACSLFGISNDIAMQAVGVGFIISVVQDSMETALNSSSDALFTATVELRDQHRRQEKTRTEVQHGA